jgi:UDP-N-acetylglucosamine 1-carboxyvinyltransferase
MDRIRISGGQALAGEIPVSGAKNAALKLMAASLLTSEPLTLANVPRLADVRAMSDLLKSFGVTIEITPGAGLPPSNAFAGDTYRLQAADLTSCFAPYDIVRKMRASFQVLAPLLARHGQAKVSLPGGCTIGARPVDLHLKALEALGASVALEDGYVIAMAPRGLTGARSNFPLSRWAPPKPP